MGGNQQKHLHAVDAPRSRLRTSYSLTGVSHVPISASEDGAKVQTFSETERKKYAETPKMNSETPKMNPETPKLHPEITIVPPLRGGRLRGMGAPELWVRCSRCHDKLASWCYDSPSKYFLPSADLN